MKTSPPEQRISIIIPVHNAGDDLRRCLQGISASDAPPFEVIVVADGYSDGSWQAADEFGARVVFLAQCRGPARARNLGARAASGELLLFIDSDVVVSPEAVGMVAGAFRHDPGLAALFGSYDDQPSAGNFLSQYKNLFHHYVHQSAGEDASTFWSGCGAVRRDVFEELSGFSEDYDRPSIEDIEFGCRLKRRGHRIRLLKGLRVKHLKRWGVVSLLRADFLYRALPWSLLILREGRMPNDLNLKTSTRLSVATVYLLTASLLLGMHQPKWLILAVPCILALLAFNHDLYRFFMDKRGFAFALVAVPWSWFYFFYSGLAFSLALARHGTGRQISSHD